MDFSSETAEVIPMKCNPKRAPADKGRCGAGWGFILFAVSGFRRYNIIFPDLSQKGEKAGPGEGGGFPGAEPVCFTCLFREYPFSFSIMISFLLTK